MKIQSKIYFKNLIFYDRKRTFLTNILYFFLCFTLSKKSIAQNNRSTFNTTIKKAENVYISNSTNHESTALLITKYINPKKPLTIIAGIGTTTTVSSLMAKRVAIFSGGGLENIIYFRVYNNFLSINSTVKGIDQKVVGIIRDNKMINSKGLFQKITDHYLQIVDEYGIPILQIILDKKSNSIFVNGVFYCESHCTILNNGSMTNIGYPKPLLSMTESELKDFTQTIRKEAKVIEELE